MPLLDHPEPYIRGWAIQLLGEDKSYDPAALKKLASMAEKDTSPIVRLYLASAIQRMPLDQRWAVAQNLVAHAEDANDHNIPKIIWYGVEPLVATDAPRALKLAANSKIPLVASFIARRAIAAKQFDAVAAALVENTDPALRVTLMEAMRDGLKSLARNEVVPPKNWSAAVAALTATKDQNLTKLLTQIGQIYGDSNAMATQLATLKDRAAPVERRREVLVGFARDSVAAALPVILSLLDEAPMRRDAIRALASFDAPEIERKLIDGYGTFTTAEKAEAVNTLSARRNTALALVAQLKSNTIPKTDVSAFDARQLYRVIGPSFVEFWGPITQLASDKQAEILKYKTMLTDPVIAKADVSNGRAIYERTCMGCHVMYGAGGNVGPELTGSNRADLDYILSQIINPSEVMQDSYQLVIVTTRDGRTVSGTVAAEDGQQLTLRLAGQDIIVAKSEIQSREKSTVSMMPEGLLKTLKDNEVCDLIAYLRTTAQVPLPK
jgi:putative heme-binding domain-containing protein